MAATGVPSFLKIFIPTKEVKVTPVIISLNVIVWLIMIAKGVSPVFPSIEDMRAWGATSTEDVTNGDYWRLFTSNYLHYGIIHLAANMFSFNNIGRSLEQFIGPWRFAVLYTFAGICGSAASIWWNPFGMGAGASGAILGIVGVLFAILTTNLIEKTVRMRMLRSMAISAGLMIIIGMQANVDNAAHLGGFCAGMVGGYFIFPELKSFYAERKKKFLGLIAACLVISGACGWFVMNSIPIKARTVQEMLSDFDTRTSAAEIGYERGMYNTAEELDKNVAEVYRYGLRLIDTIEMNDLTPEGAEYMGKLRVYVTAKKNYFESLVKFQKTGDSSFADSAASWKVRVDSALSRVNSR